jgi:hypothetical protein
MIFDTKPLDAIIEADLLTLVTDQVPEGKRIDYKQELPGGTNDEKKEFLADVSSFANASGGYLVIGADEDGGLPTAISGLTIPDVDAVKQRLENIIRDSLEPRILGISIQPVLLASSNVVLILHIPKSWNAPHVVKFQGHWRFYSRNSVGKYPLDVGELRAAFTLSATVASRIRDFRVERLSNIIAGETPIALVPSAKMVLHSVPFGAFDLTTTYDLSRILNDVLSREMLGSQRRHTFEGVMGYLRYQESGPAHQYLHVFRQGIVEYVDAYVLQGRDKTKEGGRPIIPSILYEKELMEAFTRTMKMQKQLGVELPVIVMISLLGVQGYVLVPQNAFMLALDFVPMIERNDLVVEGILIESFDGLSPSWILRQSFDTVWNAAGWAGSRNYDAEGNWVSNR